MLCLWMLWLAACGGPTPAPLEPPPVPSSVAAPAPVEPAPAETAPVEPVASPAPAVPPASDGPDEIRTPAGGAPRITHQTSVFSLDTSRPFTLWVGTGSGRDGLDIIQVAEDGTLTTFGVPSRSSRGGTLHLGAAELSELRAFVDAAAVPAMHRTYSAGVHDGSQQLLYVAQDGHERVVYCDNAFPTRFITLRDQLRAFVAARTLGAPRTSDVEWQRANAAFWAKNEP